jgi:NTP pyrophosphatase (non-canonical NTP hydrolase)
MMGCPDADPEAPLRTLRRDAELLGYRIVRIGQEHIPATDPEESWLEQLKQRVNCLTTAKGWRVNATGAREGYEFAAYIALLHSEASEMLEAYRIKQWSETREDGKPLGVGPEAADVLIRLMDMADIWGIDLEREVERVLRYGWTRPYQHGGKTL